MADALTYRSNGSKRPMRRLGILNVYVFHAFLGATCEQPLTQLAQFLQSDCGSADEDTTVSRLAKLTSSSRVHPGRWSRVITAAWRSPNGGGNSKTGWELQNRAWLPPIDRQAHYTHAHFFLPINFSTNSAPQLILKILLVVSITVLI